MIYLWLVIFLLFVKFITIDYTALDYVVKSVSEKINQNDETKGVVKTIIWLRFCCGIG